MIDTLKLAELTAPFLKGWRFNRVLSKGADSWRPIATFSNDDRETFLMCTHWRNESRFKIYGEHSQHSITVAQNRAPQAIAGDIQRRFLPQYLDDVAKYRQDQANRKASQATERLQYDLMEKACGELKEHWNHQHKTRFEGGFFSFGYNETSNNIEFNSLTFDEMLKLAFFYKSLKEKL